MRTEFCSNAIDSRVNSDAASPTDVPGTNVDTAHGTNANAANTPGDDGLTTLLQGRLSGPHDYETRVQSYQRSLTAYIASAGARKRARELADSDAPESGQFNRNLDATSD